MTSRRTDFRLRPRALAGACLLGAATAAAAFEQGIPDPAAVVTVPRLPQIALAEGSRASPGDRRRWLGRDATLAVEIQAWPGAAAGGTRACAGNFLRDLVRRPGMPDRDAIYRAPLDVGTFLVLYILDEAPARRLHAHLLAAAGEGQCIDAHFSRALQAGEDVDDWRSSFAGASVRAGGR